MENMDKKEFEFLLKEGEGQFIEFKENLDSKGLAKEIVAFANSQELCLQCLGNRIRSSFNA
jgi:predicted HTH transcriptional regulator